MLQWRQPNAYKVFTSGFDRTVEISGSELTTRECVRSKSLVDPSTQGTVVGKNPIIQRSLCLDPTTQGLLCLDPTTQGSLCLDPTTQGSLCMDPTTQGSLCLDPSTQGSLCLHPTTSHKAQYAWIHPYKAHYAWIQPNIYMAHYAWIQPHKAHCTWIQPHKAHCAWIQPHKTHCAWIHPHKAHCAWVAIQARKALWLGKNPITQGLLCPPPAPSPGRSRLLLRHTPCHTLTGGPPPYSWIRHWSQTNSIRRSVLGLGTRLGSCWFGTMLILNKSGLLIRLARVFSR